MTLDILKQELAALLSQAEEALDPELTRVEVVRVMKDIANGLDDLMQRMEKADEPSSGSVS